MALPAWDVDSLRLTLFPSPDVLQLTEPSENWWVQAVGSTPELVTIEPKHGFRRVEGGFEGGRLVLEIHPTRIDFVFTKDTAVDTVKVQQHPSSNLPFTVLASPRFYRAMDRWFPSAPSAVRLAFGAVLNIRVKNREEGYNGAG